MKPARVRSGGGGEEGGKGNKGEEAMAAALEMANVIHSLWPIEDSD